MEVVILLKKTKNVNLNAFKTIFRINDTKH